MTWHNRVNLLSAVTFVDIVCARGFRFVLLFIVVCFLLADLPNFYATAAKIASPINYLLMRRMREKKMCAAPTRCVRTELLARGEKSVWIFSLELSRWARPIFIIPCNANNISEIRKRERERGRKIYCRIILYMI